MESFWISSFSNFIKAVGSLELSPSIFLSTKSTCFLSSRTMLTMGEQSGGWAILLLSPGGTVSHQVYAYCSRSAAFVSETARPLKSALTLIDLTEGSSCTSQFQSHKLLETSVLIYVNSKFLDSVHDSPLQLAVPICDQCVSWRKSPQYSFLPASIFHCLVLL